MGNTIPTTTPAPSTTPAATAPPTTTQPPRNYNATTPNNITSTPTATPPGYNECRPPDTILSIDDCNALTNCIYASNFCYKLQFDNIGLLDNTTISCTSNRNNDGSYTLQCQAVTIGPIYIIKKISFVVKDVDDTTGNSLLSATYINLDMTKPQDKSKVFMINTNGTLSFTIKILGGTGTNNFDFTSITLTDINNRTVTLTDTSPVNTIYNKSSFDLVRNTMVKISYDPSIAQKAQSLDIQNQISLTNIATGL